MLLKIALAISVFATSPLIGSYDLCNAILRDGVRDDLAANQSKKHQLVKHQQFCAMAKKHNLSESNVESFDRDYSAQSSKKARSAGGSAGGNYRLFRADADYGENSSNEASNSHDNKHSRTALQREMLDYYQNNCGTSAYSEMLAEEAHLTTRIANKDVVDAWAKCMAQANFGTFAYPLFYDDDLKRFAVKVVYYDFGTAVRYVASVKIRWFGDNVKALTRADNVFNLVDGYETGELLDQEKLVSNGEMVVQMQRTNNNFNDAIQIDTCTGDGAKKDIYFVLPKYRALSKPHESSSGTRYCRTLQKTAFLVGAITEDQYKEYQRLDIVPVPAFPDEWKGVLYKFPCREVETWGSN